MHTLHDFLLPYKDITPFVALAISIGAVTFTAMGYRLNRAIWLSKRPYLDKDRYKFGERLKLSGPEADHWQIKSATLVWPFWRTFLRTDVVHSEVGEPSELLSPAGRILRDSTQPIKVAGSPKSALLFVVGRSKSRPHITIWRWIMVRHVEAPRF